ncbi:hypothetical protein RUM44_010533 [Polyplax serrata]|uniref:Uncharacterized protein n=1 Tax=Polyplax serrata TaxID=468196 RepID=A0ABR1AVV3_POLSC
MRDGTRVRKNVVTRPNPGCKRITTTTSTTTGTDTTTGDTTGTTTTYEENLATGHDVTPIWILSTTDNRELIALSLGLETSAIHVTQGPPQRDIRGTQEHTVLRHDAYPLSAFTPALPSMPAHRPCFTRMPLAAFTRQMKIDQLEASNGCSVCIHDGFAND